MTDQEYRKHAGYAASTMRSTQHALNTMKEAVCEKYLETMTALHNFTNDDERQRLEAIAEFLWEERERIMDIELKIDDAGDMLDGLDIERKNWK